MGGRQGLDEGQDVADLEVAAVVQMQLLHVRGQSPALQAHSKGRADEIALGAPSEASSSGKKVGLSVPVGPWSRFIALYREGRSSEGELLSPR